MKRKEEEKIQCSKKRDKKMMGTRIKDISGKSEDTTCVLYWQALQHLHPLALGNFDLLRALKAPSAFSTLGNVL
jgi:hypothetical protein